MNKPLPLFLCALLTAVALAGCPTDELVDGGDVRRPTPRPSASVPPAQGDVTGGLETGGADARSVRYVTVTPESVTLNAPAADGQALAGFATAGTFTARVILSDGSVDERGVTWRVSHPGALGVSGGVVAVQPGAEAGSYVVTAESVADPAVVATALLQVTTDGLLRLSLSPVAPAAQRTLNIVQDGRFILSQPFSATADIRLPAGSGYEAQVQELSDAGPHLAIFSGLTVRPNACTVATASLQAPNPSR